MEETEQKKQREMQVVRVEGMRNNGVFANTYRVRAGETNCGTKYEIKGLSNLIGANTVHYVYDADIKRDLEEYQKYREDQRKRYEMSPLKRKEQR